MITDLEDKAVMSVRSDVAGLLRRIHHGLQLAVSDDSVLACVVPF
jgi:hypothetical protein